MTWCFISNAAPGRSDVIFSFRRINDEVTRFDCPDGKLQLINNKLFYSPFDCSITNKDCVGVGSFYGPWKPIDRLSFILASRPFSAASWIRQLSFGIFQCRKRTGEAIGKHWQPDVLSVLEITISVVNWIIITVNFTLPTPFDWISPLFPSNSRYLIVLFILWNKHGKKMIYNLKV